MRLIIGGVGTEALRSLEWLVQGLASGGMDIEAVDRRPVRGALHETLKPFAGERPILIRVSSDAGGMAAERRWSIADRLLEGAEDARALLAYMDPAASLAIAIQNGASPAVAGKVWRDQADAVLSLLQAHGARAIVVHAASVMNEPTEVARLCQERLGVTIPPTNYGEMSISAPRPVFEYVAREITRLDPEIARRAEALDAASALMPENAGEQAADWRGLIEMCDFGREFERLRAARESARAAIADAKKQASQLQEELVQAQRHLRMVQRENGAMVRQIEQMSTAIAKGQKEAAAAHGRIARLERSVEAHVRALAAVQRSLSWRITRPVRMLRSLKARLRGNPLKVRRNTRAVANAGMFDAGWYLRRYPEVAFCGLSPLEHFVLFGGQEGRAPGPGFSSKLYMKRYPDVAAARVNPLVHYVRQGAKEGRIAEPAEPDA